jgi:hypothetical protein
MVVLLGILLGFLPEPRGVTAARLHRFAVNLGIYLLVDK